MGAWDCSHDEAPLRFRRIAGGGIQYRHQCQRCGSSVGSAVSHAKVAVLPPEWDELLHGRWVESVRMSLVAERDARTLSRREAYAEYLASPEWLERRRAVLLRDRYVCQGCLSTRATEVHHLTYAHIGAELMFELTSLCAACHDRAHGPAALEVAGQ